MKTFLSLLLLVGIQTGAQDLQTQSKPASEAGKAATTTKTPALLQRSELKRTFKESVKIGGWLPQIAADKSPYHGLSLRKPAEARDLENVLTEPRSGKIIGWKLFS